MNKLHKYFIIIIATVFTISFSSTVYSAPYKNPYPGMKIISESEGYNYFFKNKKSNSLIIYINGSGYSSVLGLKDKDNKKWIQASLANPLLENFGENYNILVPEKLNFSTGKKYKKDNPEILKKITVESLVHSYSRKIDSFLDKHNFNEIILLGASEGASLLPYIYDSLEYKNKISKMVIWGGGGLTQLKEFQILKDSNLNMPEYFREQYKKVDEMVKLIKKEPKSIDKFYFGYPYIHWSSFFNYKPLDYLKKIKIPILFIHGELDWSTPVESTKAIEKTNISNLFDFQYYPKMEHTPSTYSDLIKVLKDIEKWIKK